MQKKILLSKEDLLKEHRKLIQLLRTGSRPQLLKEAASQSREMKLYK